MHEPPAVACGGAGRSEITVGDVAMPVYEARPAAAAKVPIVVLLSEIWGVHEYIRDCARRFAKAGYCAVAPELFARAGGVAQIADTQTLLMVVNNQRREALLGDLRAAMDWARRRPGVNAERVGVNGWCWGGALTIQAAAGVPGLRAAVAWYGTPTRPFSADGATVRRPREGRQPERGDGRLSQRGPRIPRRLPAVLSAGGGRGGLGEVPAVLRAPSARLRRKSAC